MTYRKGDLPKILVLVVLIAATVWVSLHFTLGGATPPKVPARVTTRAAAPLPAANAELFAPRQHSTSEQLARARDAADPFKPFVTVDTVRTTTAPTPPPRPARTGAPRPTLPGVEAPNLRLVGVVTGSFPMAVVVGEGRRSYVRLGETLPNGWRVARLGIRTIELTKGQERQTLTLSREEPVPQVPPIGTGP